MRWMRRRGDRVLIIDRGKIVADGTVSELIDDLDGCASLEDVFRMLTAGKGAKSAPKGATPTDKTKPELEETKPEAADEESAPEARAEAEAEA